MSNQVFKSKCKTQLNYISLYQQQKIENKIRKSNAVVDG